MADEKLMDRARDELFSHINRCGVLQAEADDQRTWMDETIEYVAERYPDLSDTDLEGLYGIGIRFCQPAIAYGNEAGAALELIRRKAPEEAPADGAAAGDSEVGASEAPTAVADVEASEVPTAVTDVEASEVPTAVTDVEVKAVEEVGAA